MSEESTETAETLLEVDDAFSALGSDMRIQILQTLGEAEEPLSFSELRTSVGVKDSGQFNYHINKLDGHFLEKTEEGYVLRQAGRRVIEAVLSGTFTDNSSLAETMTDSPCPLCGAPVTIAYHQEWVMVHCTECVGAYGESIRPSHPGPTRRGYIGSLLFPPAGLRGRNGTEVLWAARTWTNAELMAMAAGVCPRCSGPVEMAVEVCEDHNAVSGLCNRCDHRRAARVTMRCVTCRHQARGPFVFLLASNTKLLAFLTSHGLNPLDPSTKFYAVTGNYEEEVLNTDPLELRLTFSVDGDPFALTIDDSYNVVDMKGSDEAEATP